MSDHLQRKISVAFVLPALTKQAGWRTHALGLIRAMSEQVEATLFVSESDLCEAGKLFQGFKIFSLPVTQSAWLHTPKGFIKMVSCFRHISRMSKKDGYYPKVDLVHSLEGYPTGLVGHFLSRRLKSLPDKPGNANGSLTPRSAQRVRGQSGSGQSRPSHIITCHGTYGIAAHQFLLDRFAYRQVLKNVSTLCPVSYATGSQVRQNFTADLGHKPITPIWNGNDYYRLINDQELDALRRQPPKNAILLSVGDVKPRKGHDTSLAAFARIKKVFPDAEYWIAGDTHPTSPFYQNLRTAIDEQKIDGVSFLGHISNEELQQRYRDATIFILTPRQEGVNFEGFGLVYLEAGAYGLPVVATRSGGVPEAVREPGEQKIDFPEDFVIPDGTGFLAGENDVGEVAEGILRLLRDPDLARRMGAANREWAKTLTWERAARQQVQVYLSILQRHETG